MNCTAGRWNHDRAERTPRSRRLFLDGAAGLAAIGGLTGGLRPLHAGAVIRWGFGGPGWRPGRAREGMASGRMPGAGSAGNGWGPDGARVGCLGLYRGEDA